ncbi:MAG TPA: hypothetical protein DIU15_01590 [Deltaproteobacteria bacterium]|nr:hypothetical protein [Deltaproteobacteria bacterium]HCP44717.1 hypothetical protein [Deltaproteobacteria bacterium]
MAVRLVHQDRSSVGLGGPRWILRLLIPLILGALISPASAGPRRSLQYLFPMDQLESFSFEVESVAETQLVRKPADAARFDLAPVEARLLDVRTRSQGRLDRSLARVFRDGSLGLIVRVVDLQGSVQRGDEGAREPLELGGLNGKSVALRVHASGELLDSHGWSHILGAQRPGSVLGDLFLQSILRLPRHPPKSSSPMSVTFRTRVPVDGSLQRDRTWTLTYRRAEAPSACGKGCLAMAYEGEVLERSADTHPARPMELRGKASVSGLIVLRSRRSRLVSHSWTSQWTHEVKTKGSEGRVRGEVVQVLREEGSIRALASEGTDRSSGARP